jgi:hypothetical protein
MKSITKTGNTRATVEIQITIPTVTVTAYRTDTRHTSQQKYKEHTHAIAHNKL